MFGLLARIRRNAQNVMDSRRTFVFRVDGACNVQYEIVADNAQQAQTLLREAHGYRALQNAQLIDIV